MNVVFLVHLNLTDVSTIADVASDISDDLTSSGHDVISVEPWTRPTLQQTNPLSPIAPGTIAMPPTGV